MTLKKSLCLIEKSNFNEILKFCKILIAAPNVSNTTSQSTFHNGQEQAHRTSHRTFLNGEEQTQHTFHHGTPGQYSQHTFSTRTPGQSMQHTTIHYGNQGGIRTVVHTSNTSATHWDDDFDLPMCDPMQR